MFIKAENIILKNTFNKLIYQYKILHHGMINTLIICMVSFELNTENEQNIFNFFVINIDTSIEYIKIHINRN